MNLPTVARYLNHHVLIGPKHFTIEHPATCDLEACLLHARCVKAWPDPPEVMGWYRLEDDLSLTLPEQRVTVALVRVADGQTPTAEKVWECGMYGSRKVRAAESLEHDGAAMEGRCWNCGHQAGVKGCGWVLLVRGAAHE